MEFFGFFALLVMLTAEGTSGQCDVSKYRKVTGACNNVRVPLQGAANNPYRRILPENTKDDFLVKHIDLRIPQGHHPHVSALLGVWGQLLQRDLDRPVYDQINDNLSQVVNSASGYLDASSIYGNSKEDEDRIRVEEGLLNLHSCTECAKQDSGRGALISMFILEHNRLVDQFSHLNPHWSHEQLFQEAKRIVIAEIQHITYNEFLPVLLGEVVTTEYSLRPQKFGRFEGYASSNAPGISYALSITALKVLSSLTPTSLMSQQGNSDVKTYDIESQLSDIFAKIVKTPADKPGHHLDYEPQEANVDTLIAQSHSARLAKYQAWLQMCRNGSTYVHYSDFYTISDEEREYLAKVYKNAADVDLLTGGILEHSQNGSILGPTFTCMLVVQFNDLRKSDRFWYENDIPPTSFTHDQLNELRKVKFSGLLCANVPSIISIQPFAFVQPDPYLNAPIGCDHHGVFDLSAWRETPQETIKTMISMEMLQEAIRKAEDNVLRRQQTEFLLWSHKGGVDPKSPAGTAAAFSKPIKQALLLANNSILLEYASNEILNSLTEKVQKLRRRRQLDSGDNVIGFGPELPGKEFLSELDVSSFLPSLQSQSANSDEDCTEENGPCDPRSPYRTFNGHCNNPERPHLGKSLTTFARLLPAVYENGISSPRQTSVTGVPLPSPRLVSAMVHADISHLHNRYTLMVMQFAQFVDHDLTFTPVHRGFFASIPDCRSCDSPLTVHPECMPIPIPNNDPFYPQVNITSGERFCLPFMRSLPGQQRLGARAQVNQNTAYLDGSQIYGQNACQARSLRAYGGRLNVTVRHNGDKDLLPLSPVHPECKAPSGYCFIAGDGRASEQAALTAIHTVYLREHNRVVLGLRGVNPHWGDEKLYQTARRITVAAYQHITYNEFLPRLLGWGAVDLYGLRLTSQGYYKGYSSSCNPNIVTEFAVAAYRIGHSLLRPHLPRMSANYQAVNPAILLRDVFFNPDVIKQRYMIDELIRGLVSTPMEDLDQFITGEITNHLFEERRIPHSGMDLPALNVQRGRDHAIPSYNDYRTLCGMKRATNWEDLSRELPSEVIARLRRIYPSVNDIDLFPAGLSERAVQGGLVGPTFACIIGLQFRQLRQCDRFWYESGDPIVRFTEPQLAEIRKATLAKSLCDNLDVSGDIQRSVFDQPTDFGNPRLPCRSLPTMDFSVWRENAEQGCQIAGRIVPVGDTALPSPCTSCVCTNEGAQCASLRVTDCSQLLREAGRDAILRDEVCAAQCANLLLSSPGPTLEALEDIVSLTTKRPVQTPHSGRSREFLPTSLIPPPPPQAQASVRRPSIRSFKLPDIAAAVFG